MALLNIPKVAAAQAEVSQLLALLQLGQQVHLPSSGTRHAAPQRKVLQMAVARQNAWPYNALLHFQACQECGTSSQPLCPVSRPQVAQPCERLQGLCCREGRAGLLMLQLDASKLKVDELLQHTQGSRRQGKRRLLDVGPHMPDDKVLQPRQLRQRCCQALPAIQQAGAPDSQLCQAGGCRSSTSPQHTLKPTARLQPKAQVSQVQAPQLQVCNFDTSVSPAQCFDNAAFLVTAWVTTRGYWQAPKVGSPNGGAVLVVKPLSDFAPVPGGMIEPEPLGISTYNPQVWCKGWV